MAAKGMPEGKSVSKRKKHRMTEQQHEVYAKSHGYEYPLDVEEGKVRRERDEYAELQDKSSKRARKRLRDRLKDDVLEMMDDDDEDWDEDEQRAGREIRNARQHKQRLQDLEDFET